MQYNALFEEVSIEEQMPYGISPEEARAVSEEAFLCDCCEFCGSFRDDSEFVETGMGEFYTMDIDPGTLVCIECLESRRLRFIPDDPSCFDCWTPVVCV